MPLLSRQTRLRVQNLLFLLLFGTAVGLLAWLSQRYTVQFDWTAGGRNTLAPASRALLARLPGPLTITAFARPEPTLRHRIESLVGRYQRHKPDLTLTFINPDTAPDRVRALGIRRDGELLLEYQGYRERLTMLTEQELTQALHRLSRRGQRQLLFLSGHGERRPRGQANHDLGTFGAELEKLGLQIEELNLATQPTIPPDVAALVIASPQVTLLPGEVKLLLDYLAQGGHLLWLLEPDSDGGLQSLAEQLGIVPLPGVVVDPDAPLFGVNNPAFVVVADYGPHPVTADLRKLTLFPFAVALETRPVNGWTAETLLLSQARSWTEQGDPARPHFDPDGGERVGPLALGVALSRPRPGSTGTAPSVAASQRVVVLGDGDFLANAYLGNGGNLELGVNLCNWLSQDDALIAIPVRTTPDQRLQLSDTALFAIGIGFLLVLPGALLAVGWLLWWWRRRR